MVKIAAVATFALCLVGMLSVAHGQTVSPSASPSPTVSATPSPTQAVQGTTVPSGAPATGFGK